MDGTAGRADRLHPDEKADNRSQFQRDRDRVLYSSAFARLARVTQVVGPDDGHVFHNRLTHSLKVAQVARRVAERLLSGPAGLKESEVIDPDVAETAALAHDLGHPPFGHIAEEELKELVTQQGALSKGGGPLDGFEGNAQSFRIVTRLARRSEKHAGLNLTRATLAAVLKYPWIREPDGKAREKWGAYISERQELEWARELSPQRRCVEADIMDWADDVTYAVHDMTDFFRAGLVPMDRLSSSLDRSERRRFFDEVFVRRPDLAKERSAYESSFENVTKLFSIDAPYDGTEAHRARLRAYGSGIIRRCIDGVEIQRSNGDLSLVKDPDVEREIAMLKQLIWRYVILNPALATQQRGQRQLIRTLFEILLTATGPEGHGAVFPLAYWELLKSGDDRPARIVADFIAGLTEEQARGLYLRLTGIAPGHVVNPTPW